MSLHEELLDKRYLGDGVYAGHDNFQIVLWLESTGSFGPDAIALEPAVMASFLRYHESLKLMGKLNG